MSTTNVKTSLSPDDKENKESNIFSLPSCHRRKAASKFVGIEIQQIIFFTFTQNNMGDAFETTTK